MEDAPGLPAELPPASFLQLPLELRNIIYDLLIQEAIIENSPPLSGLAQWQTPTFTRPHKFDLQISTKKVRYPNLHLPTNLIYTCHQINAEFNVLISSRVHHLKLTGDFMMGLSSTQAIFDILARRPWIAGSIRTVNVLLKLNHVLPVLGGVAVNTRVLEQHPWLGERLQIAELKIRKFEMKGCGMQWVPRGGWQVMRTRHWSLNWCLETMGIKMRVLDERNKVEEGHEHNTLPDLARLFETFPLLEKIDIETEHRHLLSLFPAPRDTAESFRALDQRGVEVNILLKHWQMESFCNMLHRNGIERGTIRFGDHWGNGKVALSYETLHGGRQPENRIVKFRLVDCVLPEIEAEDDGKTDEKLSRWKCFGGVWLWRKKDRVNGSNGPAGEDATSTDRSSGDRDPVVSP
jgi:hypothetical protein